MAGNADVHDITLARAAVGGDRDAFALLFERYIDEVFAIAWEIVGDRETAAKVARDTIVLAWREVLRTAPEEFVDQLLWRADGEARTWLQDNPQSEPFAAVTDEAPSLGPVHRARIVALLQIDGVPTSPKQRPAAEQPASAGSRLGLVAAVLVAVCLGAFGLVRTLGGDPSPDEASLDDEDVELATGDRPTLDRGTSSTTGPDATTTTASDEPDVTTTTTSAAATNAQVTTTTAGRPEAAGPTTPPPTAPTTTTTAGPPPEPAIYGFDGWIIGGGCPSGQYSVSIWWDTEHASDVRLRPRGGDRFSVPADGNHTACSAVGDEWVLNAMNATGTETATFVVQAA